MPASGAGAHWFKFLISRYEKIEGPQTGPHNTQPTCSGGVDGDKQVEHSTTQRHRQKKNKC